MVRSRPPSRNWRAHPVCGPEDTMPTRFWGPEPFNANAWSGFAARLSVVDEVAQLKTALGRPHRIIDVGGGTGLLTKGIMSPGQCVVVEPDSTNMPRLRRSIVSRLDVVRGRAQALLFKSGSFEAAVATWVLQYTEDPWLSVREMVRVTSEADGARVVVVQAAPDNDLVRLYNVTADLGGKARSHHGFLLAGAAGILEHAG